MSNDIILDDELDLQIENGDFVIAASDMQHVDHILRAHKGEYKDHPQVGIGISKYLKTTGKELELKREIRIQLSYDGYKNPNIILENNAQVVKIEV
jgi:hypothetical protein